MINKDYDPFQVLEETVQNLEALSGQVAHLVQHVQKQAHIIQDLSKQLINVQYMCINCNDRLTKLEPRDD